MWVHREKGERGCSPASTCSRELHGRFPIPAPAAGSSPRPFEMLLEGKPPLSSAAHQGKSLFDGKQQAGCARRQAPSRPGGDVKGFPRFTLLPGCSPPALAAAGVLAVLQGCPATFLIQKAPSCQDGFIIQGKIAQEVTISKAFFPRTLCLKETIGPPKIWQGQLMANSNKKLIACFPFTTEDGQQMQETDTGSLRKGENCRLMPEEMIQN